MTISVEQMIAGVSRSWQIWRKFVTIWSHSKSTFSQGWLSGQKHETVNLAGYALQRFESSPLQSFIELELIFPRVDCGGAYPTLGKETPDEIRPLVFRRSVKLLPVRGRAA